jgi:hypothetical protein
MIDEHSKQSLITGVASRAAGTFEAHLDYSCTDAIDQCESPIESKLLFALLHYGVQRGVETHVYFHPQSAWCLIDDECKAEYFKITPQWPHENKRIDFHIEYGSWKGWENGAALFETTALLIECDGHDFHERTKEQARKDRSRDRQLQFAGFDVFRFTGAEIHADAFGCAEEIADFLSQKIAGARAKAGA